MCNKKWIEIPLIQLHVYTMYIYHSASTGWQKYIYKKEHLNLQNNVTIKVRIENGLNQSLRANKPLNNVNVNSIADSLSAPLHMQYSFDVAKEVIDEMVTVSDDEMKKFMVFCYKKFKLFLEPACVAGLAALKYKINNKLIGKNTMVILCGSNIDKKTWLDLTN